MDGEGTYKWATGRVYTGSWKNGNMHGNGIYEWPDGRIYQGEFLEDMR